MITSKNKIKAVVFVISALALLFIVPLAGGGVTRDRVAGLVLSGGALAPAVYLAALTFLPLIGVPRIVLAAAGGALFGLVAGSLYAIAGSTMAAAFAYHLSKWSAAGFVAETASDGGSFARALAVSRGRDFSLIVLARICPVINCELVNYACGAVSIPFARFIAATVIGTIPGSVVYALLGESLLRAAGSGSILTAAAGMLSPAGFSAAMADPDSRAFLAAVALLGVFLIATTAGFYIVLKNAGDGAGVKTEPSGRDGALEAE